MTDDDPRAAVCARGICERLDREELAAAAARIASAAAEDDRVGCAPHVVGAAAAYIAGVASEEPISQAQVGDASACSQYTLPRAWPPVARAAGVGIGRAHRARQRWEGERA